MKHFLEEDNVLETSNKLMYDYIDKLRNQNAPVRGTQWDKLVKMIKSTVDDAYSSGYANSDFDHAESEGL